MYVLYSTIPHRTNDPHPTLRSDVGEHPVWVFAQADTLADLAWGWHSARSLAAIADDGVHLRRLTSEERNEASDWQGNPSRSTLCCPSCGYEGPEVDA